MTIFVVALYLPLTVSFEVTSEAKNSTAESTENASEVITEDNYGFSELDLPGALGKVNLEEASSTANLDPGDISSASKELSGSYIDLHHTSHESVASGELLAVTPSEPQPPAWGRRGSFIQPKSRAIGLPSAPVARYRDHFFRDTDEESDESDEEEDEEEEKLRNAGWSLQPAEQGNGGLRNAVHAACRENPNLEVIWVGSLGMPTDALEDDRKLEIERVLGENNCVTIFPSDSDIEGHYSHYCKSILSPIMHYQFADGPKSKIYEDIGWNHYVKVNQMFADAIIKTYKRGDVIWVHDYHLLLVPGLVRQKVATAQIGFFLHVSFPSSEVFRCLPMRKELLNGMLGADLVGFQISEYAAHFLQTCNHLLSVEVKENGVQLEDRFVNVAAFPIGIDIKGLQLHCESQQVREQVMRFRNQYPGKFIIFARDKLDKTHGLHHKLQAYDLFLKLYPDLGEHVVLIQFATSTSPQAELDSEISRLVAKIMSGHGSFTNHHHLVFLKQDIPYPQYLAIISVSDAMMITSLREGMNLTSHEFIACQESKHGSLILSEFTGSASLFVGNELRVNPWDHRQCAEAIRQAVEKKSSEKKQQWTKLMNLVRVNDAAHWFNSFLKELHSAWTEQSNQSPLSTPRLSVSTLCEQFAQARTRLFLVDYEGTLVHESIGKIDYTSPQRGIDALRALVDKGNPVYLMSSKSAEDLYNMFYRVPGLGMVAEDGCLVKFHDKMHWTYIADDDEVVEWEESICNSLSYFTLRMEGVRLSTFAYSLFLDTRNVKDPASCERLLPDCINHINELGRSVGVRAQPVESGIMIKSTKWTRETAATAIMQRLGGESTPQFLLVIGGSRENEVVYRWANRLGENKVVKHVTTVSVGVRNTEATTTITQGVTGVLSTLLKLAEID